MRALRPAEFERQCDDGKGLKDFVSLWVHEHYARHAADPHELGRVVVAHKADLRLEAKGVAVRRKARVGALFSVVIPNADGRLAARARPNVRGNVWGNRGAVGHRRWQHLFRYIPPRRAVPHSEVPIPR